MRLALALLVIGCNGSDPPRDASPLDAALDAAPDSYAGSRVLLFTRTTGFRHSDAISEALRVLPPALEVRGITVTATEDALTAAHLANVDAVVFLYTTGNDIVADRAAFEAFVRAGGGFIGLHSATDTEYTWPFYQALVVAPFGGHPAVQSGAIDVVTPAHPAMANLPARWVADDEWYNFPTKPSAVAGVQVLANLDETTYTGGSMGADHPIIWAHANLGGRALYSALGHPRERWSDPAFLGHVVGAVTWVLNR